MGGLKNIHIFSVSETHLPRESEAGLHVYCKSRDSGQGGSVGVSVSSSIPFERRMNLEEQDVEYIWIEILFPKTKGFLVGIIYHPLHSSKYLSVNFNCKFGESMLSTVSAANKECILLGDIHCSFLGVL